MPVWETCLLWFLATAALGAAPGTILYIAARIRHPEWWEVKGK